ncbi:MAG: T9SS type A sorting domain-containing protein [Candidatus Marinimicrobia bacterium]|nr:T9SS type A sorting domain-containing protein [Candidatus Neomarinimicrobiota bacterium]
MRRMLSISLILIFAVTAYAGEANRAPKSVPSTLNKNYEPVGTPIIPDLSQSTFSHALREVNGVLVDSSKNGYGMLVSETNPISRNEANTDQILMGYRQFAGLTGSSGSIGAAYTDNGGQSFTTFSNLNDGLSAAGGRYPSAVATEYYPILIWNESGGGGGGDYGGRAFYTFDEGEYGGEIFFDPTDVHNNPAAHDSWIVVPTYNTDADGNNYFNATINDWSNNRDHITFHAAEVGGWGGSAFGFSNAMTILNNDREFQWDGSSNYTATGNMDINDDGIGYYAVSAYWGDENMVGNHTIFMKKTANYGATWSPWYWEPDALLDAYFEDVFPDSSYDMFDSTVTYLGDELGGEWSPFISYDLEVITDPDGGVHVWSGVLPSWGESVYIRYSVENGVYHFYAPEDGFAGSGGPVQMEISFVGSMQMGWAYSVPGWSSNVISAAYDKTIDNALYITYYTITDTGTTVDGTEWADANIVGAYSTDNGTTWTEVENLTMTNDGVIDEIDGHINRVADDGHIYMFWQVPDYDVATIDPPEQNEDYMQRLYFADHDFEVDVSTVDPVLQPEYFSLNQNYPNPFNPSTLISFNLPATGHVELTVFDIMGRELVTLQNGTLNAGRHEVSFDGAAYSSGSYFYRLEMNGQQSVKKMLLVK